VFKLSGLTDDLFIILKTELSKAVFPFKSAFIITVNIFLSIANTDIIKSKDI
jgi:hypothetical protein